MKGLLYSASTKLDRLGSSLSSESSLINVGCRPRSVALSYIHLPEPRRLPSYREIGIKQPVKWFWEVSELFISVVLFDRYAFGNESMAHKQTSAGNEHDRGIGEPLFHVCWFLTRRWRDAWAGPRHVDSMPSPDRSEHCHINQNRSRHHFIFVLSLRIHYHPRLFIFSLSFNAFLDLRWYGLYHGWHSSRGYAFFVVKGKDEDGRVIGWLRACFGTMSGFGCAFEMFIPFTLYWHILSPAPNVPS